MIRCDKVWQGMIRWFFVSIWIIFRSCSCHVISTYTLARALSDWFFLTDDLKLRAHDQAVGPFAPRRVFAAWRSRGPCPPNFIVPVSGLRRGDVDLLHEPESRPFWGTALDLHRGRERWPSVTWLQSGREDSIRFHHVQVPCQRLP